MPKQKQMPFEITMFFNEFTGTFDTETFVLT